MSDRPAIVLVTAEDCHLCEHGHRVLEELRPELALEVGEIDWESPSGQALVGSGDPVPFPPALFQDGRLIAYGRLSKERLRLLLREWAAR